MNTGVSSAAATSASSCSSLLCRIGDRRVAIGLAHVVETMRPLPIEAFPGTPAFILGVSTIRGAVLPVVDLAVLLGVNRPTAGRFVTIRQDGRTVALVVEEVIGVQILDRTTLDDLPPLLGSVDREMFAAIGSLDAGLLLVLDAAHLVPDSVLALLDPSAPDRSGPDRSGLEVMKS